MASANSVSLSLFLSLFHFQFRPLTIVSASWRRSIADILPNEATLHSSITQVLTSTCCCTAFFLFIPPTFYVDCTVYCIIFVSRLVSNDAIYYLLLMINLFLTLTALSSFAICIIHWGISVYMRPPCRLAAMANLLFCLYAGTSLCVGPRPVGRWRSPGNDAGKAEWPWTSLPWDGFSGSEIWDIVMRGGGVLWISVTNATASMFWGYAP